MKRVLFFLLITKMTLSINAREFRLGVLADYQRSAELDSIIQIIVDEIDRTTGAETSFVLDRSKGISAGINNYSEAEKEYIRLTEISDYIILLGSNSVKGASKSKSFPTPTIGIGFLDPHLQELPFDNGRSGVKNFSYIWPSKDLKHELDVFQQIVPFKNLTVLVDESASQSFNQEKGQQYITSLKEKLSANITIVPIGDSLNQTLSSIPKETDAVYVSFLQKTNLEDIAALADELKRRKVPSFSSQKFHVDKGIMASISDKNDFDQIVRRMAIMVDESLSDVPLSEMLVNINFKEDLFINSQTIGEVGVPLSFEIMFTANFINEAVTGPVYSLQDVLEIALQNNFDIKISHQDVSLAIQDAKLARTAFLPQLGLDIGARQINSERTFVLLDQPERLLNGQLTLEQLIYSEDAMAGIKIAYYMQKAQESATEAQILQVYLNTYIDYLAVLAAKTAREIEKENLENLKANLELSRIRVNSGDASRAEILRWESEVSAASQRVVETNTDLYNAKFKLNTILANTLEADYDIADVTVNDKLFRQFSESQFAKFINNGNDIQLISEFLIGEAVANNPNKRALLQQINAVKRKNQHNKRLLYTPSVAVQAQMSQVLARGGAGSNASDFNIPNNSWNVGVGLSFPIFTGNSRRVNLKTTRLQLDQMNNSRLQLDQDLELAVKTSLTQTIATSTNIGFSKVASDNAEVNFELVREQYQAGEVTITQVIDAQQSALTSKLRYALAIYEYVQSQLQLEYAVGFFAALSTEDEQQQFNNRFNEFKSK